MTRERMSQVEKDIWSRSAIEIKPGSKGPSKHPAHTHTKDHSRLNHLSLKCLISKKTPTHLFCPNASSPTLVVSLITFIWLINQSVFDQGMVVYQTSRVRCVSLPQCLFSSIYLQMTQAWSHRPVPLIWLRLPEVCTNKSHAGWMKFSPGF